MGLYALLGAAAFLGGLMRMSAAQALILMEMTAAPQMLPFLMLVGAPLCVKDWQGTVGMRGIRSGNKMQ